MPELDYDDESTIEETAKEDPDWLRKLRQDARNAKEATARAEAAERRLAFAEAGIPLGDPKMTYFVKGYEGDLTAEAIRQAAIDAGFIPAPDDVPTEERAAHDRIAEASAGATSTGGVDLLDAINSADTADKVMEIMAGAGYPTSWNRPS